jgi:hypothetical protein
MQTMEQLMNKIVRLRREAEQRGETPTSIYLTVEDEDTVAAFLWLIEASENREKLRRAPPHARGNGALMNKFAGLDISWDALRTAVLPAGEREVEAQPEIVSAPQDPLLMGGTGGRSKGSSWM